MKNLMQKNPQQLRELAVWYREYAERAGNPWVWEARLQTAENLERQATMLENDRRPNAFVCSANGRPSD